MGAFERRDWVGAEAEARAELAAGGGDAARAKLMDALLRQERLDDVLELDAALTQPTSRSLAARAHTLWLKGRHTEANAAFEQCLTLAASDPEGPTVLAGLLLSLGLGVPALLHARVAVVNEPSAAAEALYGLCLLGIDDATSRQRFERSLRLDPQHAVAWFGLGSAQLRLGQAAAARESARRALRLAPAWKSAQSLFRDASLRARTLVDFAPLLFFVPAVAIQLTSFQVLSKGPAEWVPRLVVGAVLFIAGLGVERIIRRSRLAALSNADPELAALLAAHGPGGGARRASCSRHAVTNRPFARPRDSASAAARSSSVRR